MGVVSFVGEGKTDEAALRGLADLAYAAALDDRLWADWTEAMTHAFGACGTVFGVVDTARGVMRSGQFYFPERDFDQVRPEYVGEMAGFDPVARRIGRSTGNGLFCDGEAYDPDRPADRRYADWQYARLGLGHSLTATAAAGGGFMAAISLNRTKEAGRAGSEDRARLGALLPHFASAVRLGARHGELLQDAWWEGLGARSEAVMAILLGEDGRVLRMTPTVEALIRRADGLGLAASRLAVAPAAQPSLDMAIANAATDRAPRAGAVGVPRRAGRAALRLGVYPLARQRRFLAPHQAAALIRIFDPYAACVRLQPLHRSLFGLSHRESEVAELLLGGHSLDSAGEVLGIRRNTMRNHLQSLFRKTGTNRQSDLVRLLLSAITELR